MMLPRDDFTGVPELGYDEWRAVVPSVAGRYNPECIDPKAFAGRVRGRHRAPSGEHLGATITDRTTLVT